MTSRTKPGKVLKLTTASIRNRALLVAIAASTTVLFIFGLSSPVQSAEADTAIQLSAIYFGFLLTAESVVFASAFVDTGRWPSMYEIAGHIRFVEWLVLGGVATVASIGGALWSNDQLSTGAALLWLVADMVGTVAFIRLFQLATVEGRHKFLVRLLARGLRDRTETKVQMANWLLIPDNEILSAYNAAVQDSLSTPAANGLSELVRQLNNASAYEFAQRRALLQRFAISTSVVRAIMFAGLDPDRGLSALRKLLGPSEMMDQGILSRSQDDISYLALASGSASRYCAWLSVVCGGLVRTSTISPRLARQITSLCFEVREAHLRRVDPEPVNSRQAVDLTSLVSSSAEALYWFRDFTSFRGIAAGSASYALYQLLTGQKYESNYADGALLFKDLGDTLYGSSAAQTLQATHTRELAPSRVEFESILMDILVEQVATSRSHNNLLRSQSRRDDLSNEERLLAIHLGAIGSLAGIANADQALAALISAIVPTKGQWSTIRTRYDGALEGLLPVSRSIMSRRVGAQVITICLRLARSTDFDGQEISRFLELLPVAAREQADSLAESMMSPDDRSRDSHSLQLAMLPALWMRNPA